MGGRRAASQCADRTSIGALGGEQRAKCGLLRKAGLFQLLAHFLNVRNGQIDHLALLGCAREARRQFGTQHLDSLVDAIAAALLDNAMAALAVTRQIVRVEIPLLALEHGRRHPL